MTYSISEESFKQAFQYMPDIVHKMMSNFTQNGVESLDIPLTKSKSQNLIKSVKDSRKSVKEDRVASQPSVYHPGLPAGFADTVLDLLKDVRHTLKLMQGQSNGMTSSMFFSMPTNGHEEFPPEEYLRPSRLVVPTKCASACPSTPK